MKSITLDKPISNEDADLPKYIRDCCKNTISYRNLKTGKIILLQNECGSLRCDHCRKKKLNKLTKKLRYFAPKYGMKTFLTLTTKNKEVKHLTKLFRILRDRTSSNLDLERFMSKNKIYTKQESRAKIKKRIKQYIKEDIEISIHIIVTPKAILNVAIRHGRYYEGLEKHQKKNFKEKYKDEIEKEREKEREKYLESEKQIYYYTDKKAKKRIYHPTYDILCTNIEQRYEWIYEDKKNYRLKKLWAFWVLEFQKNGNPHYHILMNLHIPLSILKKTTQRIEFEDSISNNQQILTETLNLGGLSEKISSNRIVGYILKYITNSIDPFYSYKEAYKGNLIHFSANFFGKRGLFKNKQPSNLRPIKKFDRLLKLQKINSPCIEVEKREDIENKAHYQFIENKTYQKYKKELKECPPDIRSDTRFNIAALLRQYSYESKLQFDSKRIINLLKKTYAKKKTSAKKEYKLTKEHESVIEAICTSQNMIFLNSPGGTSKSTLISNFINTLIENKIMDRERIGVYAFQNIAVRNLSHSCNAVCQTLHRAGGSYLDGEFYKNERNCVGKDLIFIDEIVRLDPKFFLKKIIPFIKPNTKIIVAGDINQLKGFKVKKGETLDCILLDSPFVDEVCLTKNYRSNRKVKGWIERFNKRDEVGEIRSFNYLIAHLKEQIKEGIEFIVLANDRKTTDKINNALLIDGKIEIGCPVICDLTYKQKEICNCDTGILTDRTEDSITVKFTINGQEKTELFEEEEQLDISPAYAITVHRSQSSGFKKVIAYYGAGAPNKGAVNNRNSVYTAITRAKEDIEVFYEDQQTKTMCHEIEL